VWDDKIILLAVVLMSSMTQVAYTAVLRFLRNLCGPDMELTRAITDFETAQQNSWAAVFGVQVQGCLWHECRVSIFLRKIIKQLFVSRKNIFQYTYLMIPAEDLLFFTSRI